MDDVPVTQRQVGGDVEIFIFGILGFSLESLALPASELGEARCGLVVFLPVDPAAVAPPVTVYTVTSRSIFTLLLRLLLRSR